MTRAKIKSRLLSSPFCTPKITNTTTRIHLSYPIPYNAIHRYCATIRGKSFATSSLFCEQRRYIERHEHPCLSLISLRFVRAKIKSSLSYLRSFANEDKARESCSFIRLIFLLLRMFPLWNERKVSSTKILTLI